MATPHVAGVAALLFSKNATQPASAIVQAMVLSAVDLGKTGYDTSYGYGLVSAGAALLRV
jgi:serine protease